MDLTPLISWEKQGRRHLTVVYDKKTNKYIAGYSKFHPKLIFPSKKRCEGDTPLEALSELNNFFLKNGESLPIKNVEL